MCKTVYIFIISWAKDISNYFFKHQYSSLREIIQVGWRTPAQRWTTLNTNGLVIDNLRKTSCAFVLRTTLEVGLKYSKDDYASQITDKM